MKVNISSKNKIILFSAGILLFAILSGIYLYHQVDALERKEGIENFPLSYQPYLRELQKKYPNWKFTALYTNLDWYEVIKEENVFGKNLVPISYSDRWKNTKPGEYNVEVDAGWVDASKQAVEYCMDPRNFLNEVRIFQFEGLSYDEDTNHLDGIEKILYGTEFYNAKVSYLDSNGSEIHTQKKYADLILEGGKTSKVSTYHIASRIKQEVGPFLSHASIRGNIQGFEGLYNFYNIGATSSAEPMGAIKKGLQYAKDGNGASQTTKDKYLIPWNTKERAVTGGATFIGSSYIHLGQNTIYLQKFHVSDEKGGELFWHQYMTNVLAPYSESKSIYTGYKNSNLLNDSIEFIIPIYENMPEMMTESPNINPNDYEEDNTKMYANVTNTLNVRTGPSTSYEILTTIGSKEEVTRIAKGKQSGELWDKVRLKNGMIGYIFQSYLEEVPQDQITEIKLSLDKKQINKNEIIPLKVTILPEEAKNEPIYFSSDDESIVIVDQEGNVQGVGRGTATIKAESKTNGVSASISVEVYSKVEDLILDTEKRSLQIGDSFQISATVMPEDANNKKISFASEKAEIAEVTEAGKVTGISEGQTNIVVKTNEGNIEKKVLVNIIPKISEDDLTFDSSLHIEGDEITGIDPSQNTVEEISKKITSKYELEFVNYKEEKIEGTNKIGTGSMLRIKKEKDIIASYQFILYGDCNGDGKINSVDLLVLQRQILEIEMLKPYFSKAGNVRKTGKLPSSVDLLLIQRHILGLQEIKQ